ncbi:hypothetical protein [uncultured Maricaulis sp.]|uniref:hypothetical protein n=1 Tax=uncultured Maricaulis sp. TaxID=174710 RepID=UPI002608F15E|nr:hypothetical protein [uncultured Maricaulis sp.]
MQAQPTYTRPTSGQLGTAAEILVACQLMIASKGRLSSYVPLVDADGIDVMVHDKVTHHAIGLQIKSWTFQDETRPQTVQFDVGISTWRDDPGLYLLAVAIDGHNAKLESAWLMPSGTVQTVANMGKRKMSLVPNHRPTSKDRYTPYRLHHMAQVADALIAAIEA